MASDYTTNFNLDKYVGTDKPNLRDQYNSAMDKIDAQLKISSDNAALAVQTANNAASAVSGKASQNDLDALSLIIPSTAFSSNSTVKDAITNNGKINALNPPNNLEPLIENDSQFDNSARLAALINYAIPLKKVVYIPAGNYYFSTPLNISAAAHVYIEGDGMDATTLRYSGTNTFITISPSNSAVVNYGHFRNMAVIGSTNAYGITIIGAQNWYFENIFLNLFERGIIIDNSSVSQMSGNNYFFKCWCRSTTTTGYGFYIIGTSVSNYFVNCCATFTVGGSSTSARGFYLKSTNNSVMSDNTFVNCESANGRFGIIIDGGSAKINNTDIKIISCVCDGAPTGIYVSFLTAVQIIGNHINPSNVEGAVGINVADCENAIITNNEVVQNNTEVSSKVGFSIVRTNATLSNNLTIGLYAFCSTGDNGNHIMVVSSNVIAGNGRSVNGISINQTWLGVVIANNIFNTTKASYDIRNSSPHAIITGNAIADILDNSGTAVKANNISR